jgi:peptidoglycan/LPS O-acetylase OafA/YrhL
MTARARRRLSHTLTGLAAITFPKARRSDAHVVRDCAREAVDATGLRALPRESLSLATAGMRTRIGLAATELWHAPWRDALAVLALPLAAAILLVWTFGFIPRYDHWPLGEGWAMLLGGSLLAVIGAALQRRWLTAAGAIAVFVAAASPYVGFGTEVPEGVTATFFWGYSVDIGAASLLPTLLLVAGALSLPRDRRRRPQVLVARLAVGLTPAIAAAVYLLPEPSSEPVYMRLYSPPDPPTLVLGPPYSMPWIWPSRTLLAILGIALAIVVVVTWRRARKHPAPALASGLVLLSVAYPLAWAWTHNMNLPYYPTLFTALPLLVALTLTRRAARASAAAG